MLLGIAVGMALSGHPPHRSGRAAFPHPVPTSSKERGIVRRDTDEEYGPWESSAGESSRTVPMSWGVSVHVAVKRVARPV